MIGFATFAILGPRRFANMKLPRGATANTLDFGSDDARSIRAGATRQGAKARVSEY